MNKNKTGLIAGMLAVSSIITIASGKLNIDTTSIQNEASLIEKESLFDSSIIYNLVVIHCYNNLLKENQIFIAKKEITKYGSSKGFNYINFLSDNVLSDHEFTFINEEPLFDYLYYLNELNSFYTIDDLYRIYDDILIMNNISNCKKRKLHKSF